MHGKHSPADLYGPLLAKVQERRILADGKTFVDAVPKRAIPEIMTDFEKIQAGDDADLRRFVADNFDLPVVADHIEPAPPTKLLRTYIRDMWKVLSRAPRCTLDNSSALPIGHSHIVPGGRFREMYYWDSFFTMLGLMRDGERALATGIVEAMTDMIEAYGHVPNGTRTYYLGRSQPPLYHMMVELLGDSRPAISARRLDAMKREHAWWMEGGEILEPEQAEGRVARLADGALLNRYWDPRRTPRDESWGEDVATAAESARAKEDVYQDLRAGAESGWDFSSRWLDCDDLSSIRTTTIIPIDLNAFLYGLETAISACGDIDADRYARLAKDRREAINRYLWSVENGYFVDYDINAKQQRGALTAAALAPLLVGAATDQQADATADAISSGLLATGGLNTTRAESEQQWDRPNGWAPLQWIAVAGLQRYGHDDLAREIAMRWVNTVNKTFERTGLLFEKYDVERADVGIGGEYETQTGFGWTNGVTADFIDSYDLMPPTI